MALVIELTNVEMGVRRYFEYPDDYEVRSHTSGTWVNVYNSKGDQLGSHRADLVASVYRTKPKSEVPVDTRLNHTVLARDAKGRFVGRKSAS